MLNLISITPKIYACLVQISLKRPYAEATAIIIQRHKIKIN